MLVFINVNFRCNTGILFGHYYVSAYSLICTYYIAGCYKGISPIQGNMMGGTPITVTLKEECVRFIDRMTCTFGDRTVPAVADAINPGHAYCTVPMMSTSGRTVFRFTVESKDGGKTSSYDNFYLCEYILYIHAWKCSKSSPTDWKTLCSNDLF